MTPDGHAAAAPAWHMRAYETAAATAIVAIVAVEALLVAPGHLLAAQIADALLVVLLVNVGPRRESTQSPRADVVLGALRALALVPLIRVASLGLPMRDWSEPVAVLAIALPVGFVALRLAPIAGLRLRRLFALRLSVAHLYAASAGAVLGLLAYLAGAPMLWPEGAAGDRIAVGIGAAAVAAIIEELVFRGLVQGTLQRAFGRLGVLAATAIFTATYLDAGSTALVLTIALAGVVFAHAFATNGALAGVVAGHVLFVVGAGGFWPALLDEPRPQLDEPMTSIAICAAIAIAAGLACWQPLVRSWDEDDAT